MYYCAATPKGALNGPLPKCGLKWLKMGKNGNRPEKNAELKKKQFCMGNRCIFDIYWLELLTELCGANLCLIQCCSLCVCDFEHSTLITHSAHQGSILACIHSTYISPHLCDLLVLFLFVIYVDVCESAKRLL